MNLSEGTTFPFPHLVRLSVIICPIYHEGGLRFNLPKLKHFAWFRYGQSLWRHEYRFIDLLSPQLESFTTQLESKAKLPRSIFTSPSIFVLLEVYPAEEGEFTLDGVQNLYTHLSGGSQDTDEGFDRTRMKEREGLEKWLWLIEDSNDHQLETLTLAPLQGTEPSDETLMEVESLVAGCRAKGIEVIWDERGDQENFFDLVPASFIRRAESRR
ncbi:uncharacterized protein JCM6883_002961 [Sporobolomyces salmoneus]|uniref:uncharacterized protein n=1 Tax=Sporobolomyces salmoneus TaxID=183962 RepID=UPI003170D689